MSRDDPPKSEPLMRELAYRAQQDTLRDEASSAMRWPKRVAFVVLWLLLGAMLGRCLLGCGKPEAIEPIEPIGVEPHMATITGIDAYSNVFASAPDDGAQAKALDPRAIVAVALNNTFWLKNRLIDRNGDTVGGDFTWDGSHTFTADIDAAEIDTSLLTVSNQATIDTLQVLTEATIEELTVNEDVTIGGDYKYDTPRDDTRVCNTRPRFTAPNWHSVVDGSLVNVLLHNQDTFASPVPADEHWLDFEIEDIPDEAVITGAQVAILPSADHSHLPTFMPQIALAFDDVSTFPTGYQPIGSPVSDTSASVALYQVQHNVTITGQSFDYDKSKHVVIVRVRGEHGTTGSAGNDGIDVRVPRVFFTTDKVRP